MDWVVKTDRSEVTLESLEQLEDWYRQGKIKNQHYVYHPVLAKWMYVRDLEELKDLMAPAAESFSAPATASPRAPSFVPTTVPPQVQARSSVSDGVKLGCGMFIVLPLLILAGFIFLLAVVGTCSGSGSHSGNQPPNATRHASMPLPARSAHEGAGLERIGTLVRYS